MITVIAGVNGAGKSTILGSAIRAAGSQYFNPDEVTRSLLKEDLGLTLDEANAKAWQMGFDALQEAVDEDADHAFETTLGGNSVFRELMRAAELGREVRVLFCGLESPELHIQRVAERVERGGHDIPEAKIRERYTSALFNFCELLPHCREVKVFDNSRSIVNGRPQARCLFHLRNKTLVASPPANIPEWAKPLAAVAMKVASSKG